MTVIWPFAGFCKPSAAASSSRKFVSELSTFLFILVDAIVMFTSMIAEKVIITIATSVSTSVSPLEALLRILRICKRIQEIDFGVLEGSRFKDEQGKIISHEMEIFFEEPQKFERPQNGENISDILKRTREFWVEKTTDPALADKTILVSSHGCAVRALLQNVYQDPEHFWHGCVPPNCSINLLEVKDGKARFLEEDKVYSEM